MRLGILIPVLIYEAIVIFGASIYLMLKNKNKVKEEGEFALAGRNMGIIPLASTVALCAVGSAHFLGVFEMSYDIGAVSLWFCLSNVFVIVICSYCTGRWLRRMGSTTVPEVLAKMYGKGVSLMITCVMSGVIWGFITLETQGIGIVFAPLTGWSITQAAVVGGILGIFYVLLGGMEEMGLVNVINAAVMYISVIIITIAVARALPGGNFESVRLFYESDPDTAFMTNVFGNKDLMITFAAGNIISVLFCHGISQDFVQPYMAAKDEKTVKNSVWIAAIMNGMVGVFTVVLGLTARSIPEFAEVGAKMAALEMIIQMVPSWASALLMAALLAAILSTFAMAAFTPATMFAFDIYKSLYNPQASEKKLKFVMRIAIVLLAGVAIGIAAFLPEILGAFNWLFAWIVPIFGIFVLGLWWKRSSKVAAATLIITWAANCLWSFTPLPRVFGSSIIAELPNGYVTLIVSYIVLIIGNLVVKGEPAYRKVIDFRENGTGEPIAGVAEKA